MTKLYQKKLDELNQKIKKSSDNPFVYGFNEVVPNGISGQIENYFIEIKKVKLKEKAFFFSLFSVLINAGITTIQTLKVLANKTPNPKFRRIINTLAYDVERGESLSNAMSKFPDTFSQAETGVVRSGEAIGALDRIMARLAKQTEDQNKLITQLKGSLTYPAIVMVILSIAGLIMFGFVVPKLVDLFIENNLELPTITKVMLQFSYILQNFWGLILITLIIGLIFSNAYFHSEEGRFQFDLLKLRLPVFGSILKKVYIIRFMSTLSVLLEAGVPLHTTIDIISEIIENQVYKLKTIELREAISQGYKISANLEQTPFLFPETVAKIMEIGEQSASISEMSDKIATQYLDEVDFTLKNLSSIVGPVVIVVVGIFVAIFALAILSPIFQLSEGIV